MPDSSMRVPKIPVVNHPEAVKIADTKQGMQVP